MMVGGESVGSEEAREQSAVLSFGTRPPKLKPGLENSGRIYRTFNRTPKAAALWCWGPKFSALVSLLCGRRDAETRRARPVFLYFYLKVMVRTALILYWCRWHSWWELARVWLRAEISHSPAESQPLWAWGHSAQRRDDNDPAPYLAGLSWGLMESVYKMHCRRLMHPEGPRCSSPFSLCGSSLISKT